jgi:hypothetical protein
MPRRALIIVVATLLLAPRDATAQGNPLSIDTLTLPPLIYPSWVGTLTTAGGNVLLGALTGGISQKLHGRSFKDGFTRGALGGLVTYGGKRITAARFAGAGLLGRELGAVGSSMVRNAGEAQPIFERLILPFGPLRFYATPRSLRATRVRVDVFSLGWTIYAIAEPKLSFDAAQSLSAGGPVFRTHNRYLRFKGDSLDAGGVAAAGVLLIGDIPALGRTNLLRIIAHERVHTVQQDAIFTTIIDPLQAELLPRLPFGATTNRFVDLNFSTDIMSQLARFIPRHDARPWELEAEYLARLK